MPCIVATYDKYKAAGYDTGGCGDELRPAGLRRQLAETRRPFTVAIDNTGEIARKFGNVH